MGMLGRNQQQRRYVLGLKVESHTNFMASLVESLAFNECRERELHAVTKVLAVPEAHLTVVTDLGLQGEAE